MVIVVVVVVVIIEQRYRREVSRAQLLLREQVRTVGDDGIVPFSFFLFLFFSPGVWNGPRPEAADGADL